MTESADYAWYWGAGREPERYHGPFETREAAIGDCARVACFGPFTICEATMEPLRDDVFDAEFVMDQWRDLNEYALDLDGDDPDPTPDQDRELEAALAATFAAWRKRHNIGRAWAFAETRNVEVIERDV